MITLETLKELKSEGAFVAECQSIEEVSHLTVARPIMGGPVVLIIIPMVSIGLEAWNKDGQKEGQS